MNNDLSKARKLLAQAGGLARAKTLSKKRRSEIARMGALAKVAKQKKV